MRASLAAILTAHLQRFSPANSAAAADGLTGADAFASRFVAFETGLLTDAVRSLHGAAPLKGIQ